MSARVMAGLAACLLLQTAYGQSAKELSVLVGKSLVVDSPVNIQRVSLADGGVAEALVTSPRELLIHGKAPGQTSLIVWQQPSVFRYLRVVRCIERIHLMLHITGTYTRPRMIRY